MAKKTVIYTRVSTTEQAQDGVSLARQEEQGRGLCLAKGYENPMVLTDKAISGTTDNRPAYQELLELCSRGKVARVIVADMSRLSRSVKSFLNTMAMFEKKGVEFISLKQSIDTSTAAGKMMLTMVAAMNEFYANDISDKTRVAIAHKKAKGEKTGGDVPYGFNAQDGKLIKHPTEYRTLRRIKHMRATGKSLRAIAATLTGEGVRTKRGKANWQPRSISRILSSGLI